MTEAGVTAFGVADCGPIDSTDAAVFDNWIARGMHAGMDYMERHADLRRDPQSLLPGCRSVVSCAIAYDCGVHHPGIATYALGNDYHEVVRRNLERVAAFIRETIGGETRVCVDTAPLRERYWAVRAGVGFMGINGHLIVPGAGCACFLGEILTTVRIEPTRPLDQTRCDQTRCEECGACVKACPTGALRGDGSVDARRCLSYLTIEHRGDFPTGTDLHGRLYGCDACVRACPHNRAGLCTVDELQPRPEVMEVTADMAAVMTQEDFSRRFSHSAIKRAKLAGLHRNAAALLRPPKKQ